MVLQGNTISTNTEPIQVPLIVWKSEGSTHHGDSGPDADKAQLGCPSPPSPARHHPGLRLTRPPLVARRCLPRASQTRPRADAARPCLCNQCQAHASTENLLMKTRDPLLLLVPSNRCETGTWQWKHSPETHQLALVSYKNAHGSKLDSD